MTARANAGDRRLNLSGIAAKLAYHVRPAERLRRRGLPNAKYDEHVAAIAQCREEMARERELAAEWQAEHKVKDSPSSRLRQNAATVG